MRRPTMTRSSSVLSLLCVATLSLVVSLTCSTPDDGTATPGSQEVVADPVGLQEHSSGEDPMGDRDADAASDVARRGEVHLTPKQIQRLEIRTEAVEMGSARSTLARPAKLRFDMDRHALVGPRIAAKVVRVTADLGDSVEPGQVLALMNSVGLGRSAAKYLALRSRLATERAAYLREQELAAGKISSEAAMLEAQARFREAEAEFMAAAETLRLLGLTPQAIGGLALGSDTPLSHFELKSPISGLVQKRDLAIGDSVSPDETPIHIADPSRLWLMIDAQERDLPLLASGQAVTLRLRSLPGRVFPGKVDWISQELDRETQTLPVRAVVPNPDLLMRAGMFGTALIRTDEADRHALVRVGSVQSIDGQAVVFVSGEVEGSFELRPVETGAEDESSGFVEVLAGLAPGERVVAHGAFELKSAYTAASLDAAQDH